MASIIPKEKDGKMLFAPERPPPLPYPEYDFRLCGATGHTAEKPNGQGRPA